MLITILSIAKKLFTNKYVLSFIAIAIVIIGIVLWHNSRVDFAVEQATNQLTDQYELQKQKEIAKVEETSSELLQQAYTLLENKQNEIEAITSERDNLVSELRKRSKRTKSDTDSTVTKGSGTCTGAELFREDAEFLAREASRADRILIERNKYYELYEQARLKLQQLQEDLNNGRR